MTEKCALHGDGDSDEGCPDCAKYLDEYVKNERGYLAQEIARIATSADPAELENSLNAWPLQDIAVLEQFCAHIGGKTRGYSFPASEGHK